MGFIWGGIFLNPSILNFIQTWSNIIIEKCFLRAIRLTGECPMLSRYKAVFFDVGGTLLRVHPSVGEVYAMHARSFGFRGSGDELDERFRRVWEESGGVESLGNQSNEAAERRFWHDIVFRVFEPYGGLCNFENYFERVYTAFCGKDHWRIFDDVVDSCIFDKLKQEGIVLGVISNWDSRLHTILESTGLAEHFDFILASAEVGSTKPDGKIFAEALKQSGVMPEDACHIGDDPYADVHGAETVGMDAILIDRKGRHKKDSFTIARSFMELL
jgi:putative hydrolase of the HAD superfamily